MMEERGTGTSDKQTIAGSPQNSMSKKQATKLETNNKNREAPFLRGCMINCWNPAFQQFL
jgi:hypothetical protein